MLSMTACEGDFNRSKLNSRVVTHNWSSIYEQRYENKQHGAHFLLQSAKTSIMKISVFDCADRLMSSSNDEVWLGCP